MFDCHCTSPWKPLESCAVHQPVRRGQVVVALGVVPPPTGSRVTSEDKAAALSERWCKTCNALLTPSHICTRHPSEKEEKPY